MVCFKARLNRCRNTQAMCNLALSSAVPCMLYISQQECYRCNALVALSFTFIYKAGPLPLNSDSIQHSIDLPITTRPISLTSEASILLSPQCLSPNLQNHQTFSTIFHHRCRTCFSEPTLNSPTCLLHRTPTASRRAPRSLFHPPLLKDPVPRHHLGRQDNYASERPRVQ